MMKAYMLIQSFFLFDLKGNSEAFILKMLQRINEEII